MLYNKDNNRVLREQLRGIINLSLEAEEGFQGKEV